jgi:[ribosomal protein S5]-alanine N-acetyltransferase
MTRKVQARSVLIRPPTQADCHEFLSAVRRSRSLHHPWVSPPATRRAFASYLEKMSSGAHLSFLVIHAQTRGIVGVINLNNIIRGPFQNAFLGYYAFLPHVRKGFMTEGMQLVLGHAFRIVNLHRLEANIQPENSASLSLVRKCGFVREGFSRRYLKIARRWRDHERWAILAEDFTRTAVLKQS